MGDQSRLLSHFLRKSSFEKYTGNKDEWVFIGWNLPFEFSGWDFSRGKSAEPLDLHHQRHLYYLIRDLIEGPKIWKDIPNSIRNKTSLKTFSKSLSN